MKTLTSFLIIAISVINSFAQQDTISNNIYQYNGNLGVGIHNPTYTIQIKSDISSGIERNLLHINNLANGNTSYTGVLIKTGDDNYQSVIQDYGINYTASPYYDFAGFLNLSNNSKGLMLHANSSDGIIKFYTGHDPVAGAGIERLRIDSEGNIGIGTNSPKHKLEIIGDDIEPVVLALKNNYSTSVNLYVAADADYCHGGFTTRRSRGTYDLPMPLISGDRVSGLYSRAYFDDDYQVNSSIEMYIGKEAGSGSYSSNIRFSTTSPGEVQRTERMRISEEGNVGIGTSEPLARVQIADGDIYISNIEKGIIMKSPDGNCWRGTLDDSGNLNFKPVACPGEVDIIDQIGTEHVQVNIFPVPSESKISIAIEKVKVDDFRYTIHSLSGSKVGENQIKSNFETIDISNLEYGIYILNIWDKSGLLIASHEIAKL